METLGIVEEPFSLTDGNYQGYARGRCIAVSPVAELPHKTRFHELAHVVLGHTAEAEAGLRVEIDGCSLDSVGRMPSTLIYFAVKK